MLTLMKAGALAALALAADAALGAACVTRQIDGRDHVVCDTTSRNGRTMRLTFPGRRVTGATDTALLCADPAGRPIEAKLWMPDHGHGSGPTTLTRRADGCTDVGDIEFIMPGAWEVIVRFNDGDRGTFDVAVVR